MPIKAEYKQTSFETAVRNPERYLGILNAIKKYEGNILNDENLLKIVCELYLQGEVSSTVLEIDENSNIENIVKVINASRKADGGFPQGYQSRFWTYMRTLSELGFVYAQYNEKFVYSDVTKQLLEQNIDEQEAFSIQLLRTNRKSPYRNILNDYNYFKFIIKVLIELKKENKKLSYNEFVVSTFSENGNVHEFIDLIKSKSFVNSEETFDYIKSRYSKVNKKNTVMKDYPDVILRLLRITGFVTVTSHGSTIYIEFNEDKSAYYNDLTSINFVLTEEDKKNKIKYFKQTGYWTDEIKNVIQRNRGSDNKIEGYNLLLKGIVDTYKLNKDNIIENIYGLRKNDDNVVFKYIPAPLRLEFLITALIYLYYGNNYTIRPNYKIDSNGMPISHAPGNKGDIEVYSKDIYWLLEVTLITNRVQQYNNETTNLIRHLNGEESYKECFLSLIAPYIHEDTKRIFDLSIIMLMTEGIFKKINAKTYSFNEFVDTIENECVFKDMKDYTNELKEKIRANLM